MAKVDVEEAFSFVTQLRRQILVFVGIVLLLVVYLGFSFANSIAKPILTLQKGMEIIGA